jgi:hypothetical protein
LEFLHTSASNSKLQVLVSVKFLAGRMTVNRLHTINFNLDYPVVASKLPVPPLPVAAGSTAAAAATTATH